MREPITDAERTRVRALHAAGRARNDIARELGRSGSTVSKIAREEGLSFARGPEVVAATDARRLDLAARRQQLAEALHEDAERLRAQLWAPCTIGAFGGKDNEWAQVDLDRPPFADQRQILAATSIAVDKSLKLAPSEGGEGAEDVRSMLGTLGEVLADAFADDEQGADDGG
ncbi:helix-turn-helix domain-containing protein [Streptomyces sp. RKAG293]|uniref:helix-turn-helix domain-containing protein n=1 Tax=Streptomyces sp. RKAG293 TaxID=2893403 RepID=UPI0020342DDD|nr:helix-turn-helix domain-containing protein [Streptomyces sp. RKAG293]MCM2420296.1 helix-turn-helix domain-containing protein [Streptomyces sp. RKAG293]